jgi:NTE family protein
MGNEKVLKNPRAATAAAQIEAEAESETRGKVINLALQGGGAHGAFGWGVMDKFLGDGRLSIEGVSGTSAGSMDAVVYAYGKIKGNDGAREALHNVWKAIFDASQLFAIEPTPLVRSWVAIR